MNRVDGTAGVSRSSMGARRQHHPGAASAFLGERCLLSYSRRLMYMGPSLMNIMGADAKSKTARELLNWRADVADLAFLGVASCQGRIGAWTHVTDSTKAQGPAPPSWPFPSHRILFSFLSLMLRFFIRGPCSRKHSSKPGRETGDTPCQGRAKVRQSL